MLRLATVDWHSWHSFIRGLRLALALGCTGLYGNYEPVGARFWPGEECWCAVRKSCCPTWKPELIKSIKNVCLCWNPGTSASSSVRSILFSVFIYEITWPCAWICAPVSNDRCANEMKRTCLDLHVSTSFIAIAKPSVKSLVRHNEKPRSSPL